MNKKLILGLMSGTSLDGLDIALCEFYDEDEKTQYQIVEAETIAYEEVWQQKLNKAHRLQSDELLLLHHEYGEQLGKIVNAFLLKHGVGKERVDLISSHGHTIFHQPDKGMTFQLGHGASIFKVAQIPVICDFRTQDVVYGGQGAPLVPIGDKLLFSEYDFCLNIGGIANVSFDNGNKRIAWDICPANMVLNYFAQKIGKKYDEGGRLAKDGNVNTQLLHELNNLDFYSMSPPKTLGREWVFDKIIPLVEKQNISVQDALATFVEHIAIQVSEVIGNDSKKSLLITGGGAYNNHLIERINNISDIIVKIPDNITIEFKEALIFALLGYLKSEGRNNILSSVTGAFKDHSSGILYNC
jgi:anhydro-N-acetylmuramic acid kinase